MACILHIETSTRVCSSALSLDGKIIFERCNPEDASHSASLGVYVQEAVAFARRELRPVEAVAVSAGPGSYTGLRIGVSEAKGLGYGWNIPVIALPSLKILAASVSTILPDDCYLLCPMIDARRMEVYAAIYDRQLNLIRDVQADIVDTATYEAFLAQGKVAFFGDGAEKCRAVIPSENALFLENRVPLATAMAPLAEEAFRNKDFVDTAYFEPFYLKEFQATTPKKRI
ncbi:MAG: tRNA (adenosine(37)-N6)-threonylcarbamoyltransferase complex dimerization subunit type 1 TsaB [Dysgonamonadaceae bacterium]|jgi:tRNA threonylcarbamoyladenosine biosynthesis protein TsaB|nr:tRNA (adenosine(37)-N6)-threonylcarbamoyltransferase complex dimerization subunit type 1 TsaB [Dysgonamonadaceae bacterium]